MNATMTSSMNISKTFLTIPLEIRHLIYKVLFQSIIIRHGFEDALPSSQHTSLLRTCRQINTEAKEYIAPNILLHFSGTAKMLDCMTLLPANTISNLRHVRVKGYPMPLYINENGYGYMTHNFFYVLLLFPGLQLDVLTIEDPYHPGDGFGDLGTYYEIETLLETTGWKQLRYISPCSDFISSGRDHDKERVAQPEGWNKQFKDITVSMFVARDPEVAGMAEDSNTRSEYVGLPGHITRPEVDPSTDASYDDREVLVVAQRREGVPYVQDGDGAREDSWREGFKKLFERMTWQQVKESGKYVDPEDDPTAHL